MGGTVQILGWTVNSVVLSARRFARQERARTPNTSTCIEIQGSLVVCPTTATVLAQHRSQVPECPGGAALDISEIFLMGAL